LAGSAVIAGVQAVGLAAGVRGLAHRAFVRRLRGLNWNWLKIEELKGYLYKPSSFPCESRGSRMDGGHVEIF
jgi:hypothetical protein